MSKIICGYIESEPSRVDETCSERTPPNVYCVVYFIDEIVFGNERGFYIE